MQKRVNHGITTTFALSFFTLPLLVFIVLESCSHDCHEIELAAADALKPAPENNSVFVLLCEAAAKTSLES